MDRAAVTVRPATATERKDLVAIHARAFFDDPLFAYFQPRFDRQYRSLPGFFAASAVDAGAHGEVWTAIADGRVRGGANWYPPGVKLPTGGIRMMRQARRTFRSIIASGRRGRDAIALLDATVRHHPKEPHWYLAVLGVDPSYQGRGLGAALLRPVLERADADGQISYLETQKQSNIAFYARLGFEVTEELRIRRCPPVWTMTRMPRVPDPPA